ncbi:MAG: hypothetical protein FWD53_10800 [Phycisphaerales bacterium]|nr:hypothetical protein [Phycisphaerales bacterium]
MKSDLAVIAADGGIERVIRGILNRPESLGIRPLQGVKYSAFRPLDHGAYSRGHELAAQYQNTHEHALLIFDFDWKGRPADDASEMTREVENKLAKIWGDNGRCVIIEPELEIWIWSDSPHVAKALGWDEMPELRRWLEQQKLWEAGSPKPADPKKAYLRAIREKKIPPSNAIFNELAMNISFNRCQDRSFLRLKKVLRDWFGKETHP